MAEYTEITGTIEVPKNAGIEGFLKAIKGVLKLLRVQSINIRANGTIEYTYYLREGEQAKPELQISFDELMPYAIIRNGDVQELRNVPTVASTAIMALFDLAAVDQLHPTALVVGANSQLWDWYQQSMDRVFSKEEVCGVPIFRERLLEDHVVVLCAGYIRGGELIDTKRSYKICIPPLKATP